MVFYAFGAFFFWQLWRYCRTWRIVREGEAVLATVVEWRGGAPALEYVVEGRTYHRRLPLDAGVKGLHPGDMLTLYVDPQNPGACQHPRQDRLLIGLAGDGAVFTLILLFRFASRPLLLLAVVAGCAAAAAVIRRVA